VTDTNPENIMQNLPRYLHFMFAILLGEDLKLWGFGSS